MWWIFNQIEGETVYDSLQCDWLSNNTSVFALIYLYLQQIDIHAKDVLKSHFEYIVTDLINALLGNSLVNTSS
jgi:hypothetical protein